MADRDERLGSGAPVQRLGCCPVCYQTASCSAEQWQIDMVTIDSEALVNGWLCGAVDWQTSRCISRTYEGTNVAGSCLPRFISYIEPWNRLRGAVVGHCQSHKSGSCGKDANACIYSPRLLSVLRFIPAIALLTISCCNALESSTLRVTQSPADFSQHCHRYCRILIRLLIASISRQVCVCSESTLCFPVMGSYQMTGIGLKSAEHCMLWRIMSMQWST